MSMPDGWNNVFTRHEPLSKRDEQCLARMIQRGGAAKERAVEKLVEHNVRFAVSFAGAFHGGRGVFEDQVSAAILGLYDAAKRFRPVGCGFISYAVWHVKSRLQREAAGMHSPVRMPAYLIPRLGSIEGWVFEYRTKHQREPDHEEVLAEFGQIAIPYQAYRASHLRLNAPTKGTDRLTEVGDTFSTAASSEDLVLDRDNRDLIDSLFETYRKWMMRRQGYTEERADRDIQIVRRNFGLDGERESLEGIGKSLGISRERVRQLKDQFLTAAQTSKDFEWAREEAKIQGIWIGLEGRPAKPAGNPQWRRTTSEETSMSGASG